MSGQPTRTPTEVVILRGTLKMALLTLAAAEQARTREAARMLAADAAEGCESGCGSQRRTPMANDAVAACGAWMASFQERAVAAGKVGPHALLYLTIYHDGTGLLRGGGVKIGGSDTPIAKLQALAEEWLARDEAADINAILGLTPAGEWAWPGDNDSYMDAYLCQELPT